MTNQPPPVMPRALTMMQHTFVVLQCVIDGNIWDRNQNMTPPCQHTDQEYADWATANGKPQNSPATPLARWNYFGRAPSKQAQPPSPAPKQP